ncbi:hypothetical protein [Cyclobacterium xiamenense]|uniref:hypothetical protein n=1 Tax=Cyclobacterium xiamenense TaxID=1297121 RepID=UPI0012B94502|nr:hypothetical protein [Cyclobacterium xiamenense]
MKNVVVKADLSLVSNAHRITVSNNGSQLLVDIIGKSAFYLPYRQWRDAYKFRKRAVYLDQEIQIRRNHSDLLKVTNGNIKIDSYLGVFKLLIRSLFA